jgi:hypothetical protein
VTRAEGERLRRPAFPIGVRERFEEAPDGVADETQRQQPEERLAERLAQQRAQRASHVGDTSARSERGARR